jgi:hypothetical protein
VIQKSKELGSTTECPNLADEKGNLQFIPPCQATLSTRILLFDVIHMQLSNSLKKFALFDALLQ